MRIWKPWLIAWMAIAVVVSLVPVAYIYHSASLNPEGLDPHWKHWLDTDYEQRQPAGAFGFHIFDVINAILLFSTLIWLIRSVDVAEAALRKTHHAYVRALVDARYDAMDKLYFELLKERRENGSPKRPGQQDTQPEANGDDPYPLMVWNFIETIIDKCEKDPSGELMETWAPIISAETRTFGWWIVQTNSEGKLLHSDHFKNDFMLLAQALVRVSDESLSAGEDLNGPVFLRLYRALKMIKDAAEKNDDPDYRWIAKAFVSKGTTRPAMTDPEFVQLFNDIHKNSTLREKAEKKWSVPPDKKIQ